MDVFEDRLDKPAFEWMFGLLHLAEETIRIVTFDENDSEVALRGLLEASHVPCDSEALVEVVKVSFPISG
tara:strand:- start:357 stop:566 length:210 start_codon:yes stop_codon:yes gene_type:complete